MIEDTKISTKIAGYISGQSVTSLNDGGFVVSWDTDEEGGYFSDIHAQIFNLYRV